MKSIVLGILFCCITQFLFGNGGHTAREIADGYFDRMAYNKAATYYEKSLKKQDDLDARRKLATCYDLNNDYQQLAAQLKIIVAATKEKEDAVNLQYAEVLQIVGNYQEAAYFYELYLKKHSQDHRAHNQLKVCRGETNTGDVAQYEIEAMSFNTEAFEYSPVIYESSLYYTSTSNDNGFTKKHLWTGAGFSDLKKEVIKRETKEKAQSFNTIYNDGPFVVDPISQAFYSTRNNTSINQKKMKKVFNNFNYMNLKIYIEGKGSDLYEFEYNNEDFNTGHPAISRDGKYLVFVSDIPSYNIGGRDLYFCIRSNDDKWSKPVLLNTKINTEGDELFPYFHADGSLYFSSDGLGSLGGLDIFKANIDFEANTTLSVNRLGSDINSTYDDFGIVFKTDKEGYFTSDRPGGKGKDDIYHFEDNTMQLKIVVVNAETDEILPYAQLKFLHGNQLLYEGPADDSASYETRIHKDQLYTIFADMDLFFESEQQVNSDNAEEGLITTTIALKPIKYTLRIIDAISKQPIGGAKVAATYGYKYGTTQLITDANGMHELKVFSNTNYDFKIKAIGYLAKDQSWETPQIDGNELVIIELDEISFEPIALQSIYYDFDKAYLRLYESDKDLEKIYRFLTENPELTVQINSHTDARGKESYNKKLSQERAQSVVNYLVGRNIANSRLRAVGFGESQLINNCKEGAKCSEQQHQQNRRTEFQVVNADGTTKIKSNNRIDITTDKCKDCPF